MTLGLFLPWNRPPKHPAMCADAFFVPLAAFKRGRFVGG